MKTLGERIRFLRGEESQAEFAERVGIAKGSVGGYENDKNSPSADAVLKICLSYDISSDWLLKGEGPMHSTTTAASLVDTANRENPSQSYSNIEKKLNISEEERRELAVENRKLYREKEALYKEKEELLREIGELREKIARLETERGRRVASHEEGEFSPLFDEQRTIPPNSRTGESVHK